MGLLEETNKVGGRKMRCDIVPLGQKYRGMGRSLDVTHFKNCLPKDSFDDLLEVYFDYIDYGCEINPMFDKLLAFYKKFRDHGVYCEVIAYATYPIENLHGYTVELLGIDIAHDMCESLIAEDVNPNIQNLLNENGLCQTVEDVETIIPFQDHGTVEWQPCYVYTVKC